MLRVAVPNKGTLSEPASEILSEAGYRRRTDSKDLTVIDPANQVEFFFLRPKDIAIYVGSGELDLASPAGTWWATPTPRCANAWRWDSARRAFATPGRPGATGRSQIWPADGSPPRIRIWSEKTWPGVVLRPPIRLDGAVEISIQLGVADAIADVVGSGRTLSLHNLVAIGDPLCDSEAVLIESEQSSKSGTQAARDQLVARIQGVVFGQQYLMLDYDCPRSVQDKATAITPGLESPTIAPLADPDWVPSARWCRVGASTTSWTSWPPSGRRRSWPPTSGFAASDCVTGAKPGLC